VPRGTHPLNRCGGGTGLSRFQDRTAQVKCRCPGALIANTMSAIAMSQQKARQAIFAWVGRCRVVQRPSFRIGSTTGTRSLREDSSAPNITLASTVTMAAEAMAG
jgi:hypothetical protein